MADSNLLDYEAVSLMATDSPVAVYRKGKGILGKVEVKVYNSLTSRIETLMLEGNPSDPDCDKCFVELWSDKEVIFFKRANRWHINNGFIVPFSKKRPSRIKKTFNNLTDEELEEIVGKPFLALKNAVEKMTTETALTRVISVAEEMDKPEKTMNFLRERLSLIQSGELEDKE